MTNKQSSVEEEVKDAYTSGFQAGQKEERQKQEEMVNLEKEYVNAYVEFVDDMSVGTTFDVAFETLNKKLSIIFDKKALAKPNKPN